MDLSTIKSNAMLHLYTNYLKSKFEEELDAALHSGYEADISLDVKGLNI